MYQAEEWGSVIFKVCALCFVFGLLMIPVQITAGRRYLRCASCTQRVHAPKSQRDVACPMCGVTILENGRFPAQAVGYHARR